MNRIRDLLAGSNEHRRLLALLEEMPDAAVHAVLHDPPVDLLLELQPPLESFVSDPLEQLNMNRTAARLTEISTLRGRDPRTAMRALADVLKRIRNHRAHGFKTPDGPRDTEILSAATSIVRFMAGSAAEGLRAG